MKILSAKTRITIGLACLVFSVLCTAMMIGLMPDPRAGVLAGRARTCESIAMASSDFISRNELKRVEFFLQGVVKRNDEILSAGVRRANGELVAEIGDHTDLWKGASGNRSTATHVHVPIRSSQESWGTVELRFVDSGSAGLAGWMESPWVKVTTFVTAVSYLLFYFYLSRMLRHLDPGKAVPKRVRSALDSLAEGLLVIDRNDRIVLANQAFSGWVGRSSEKLLGTRASRLDWCNTDDAGQLESFPWTEALRLEAAQAGVMLALQQKNRAARVLMANASPVLGHDGKYQGVLVSFDDVTQLENTKRDLSVAKREAEDANQAKSDFLARMSHEIRTPMNAILGYTDVLRRGFDESVENRQEYLDTIHGSGEHLLALINDILDLSKVESGRMELELQRSSPHKLLSQSVEMLRSKADEKGISLEFRCDGPLPETILTDSVRLRQTIVNLTGNAIKFTEKGGVTIVARLVQHSPDRRPGPHAGEQASTQAAGAALQIDVTDTGIGISKEAQALVFEPFAQADTSVTRRFGGTGLGLAISRQLAEAMGGGIVLSSEEGKGSTFTVTIDPGPLDGVKLVDADLAAESEAGDSSAETGLVQLPPGRILVADDGASNRKLVELVIRRAGADVVAVEDGQKAVEAALGGTFDVILMDMQMPVMDGYTAATTLRRAGYTAPIIALTAHAMRGDEEKCLAAGCSGFLTKPINIDKLIATLAELIDASKVDSGEDSAPRPEVVDDQIAELHAEVSDMASSVREATTPSAGEDDASLDEPVSCSLPLDDIDFLEIAYAFEARLSDQLEAMQRACQEDNMEELASLAHWLKGSGGTAGFDAFTEPAAELEVLAKSASADQIEPAIERLIGLRNRISLPALPALPEPSSELESLCGGQPSADNDDYVSDVVGPAADPIVSSLPTDDPEFLEIVEEFVGRLEANLVAMQQAVSGGDYAQLANLAHWLKGSGGTAGFDVFTNPARRIEDSIKRNEVQALAPAIAELDQLSRRIVIHKSSGR